MLKNTSTDATECTDGHTLAALDALEAGLPAKAADVLPGAACTISIGADHYAGRVVSASSDLKRIVVEFLETTGWDRDREPMTFRWSDKISSYKTSGRRQTWRLYLGEATSRLDPCR